MTHLRDLFLQLFFAAAAFGIYGCYEPVEGCLDPEAENYQITADDPCCCDYPDRGLRLEYKWDSLTFRLNRDYVNDFGDSFRITALHYVAHHARWFSDGLEWHVEESLTGIPSGGGDPVRYIDDWMLLGPTRTTAYAGSLREYGEVDSFMMSAGYGSEDLAATGLLFPAGHPLDTASSPLYDNQNGVWNALRVTVIYGNFVKDTTAFSVPMITGHVFSLREKFDLPIGRDHELILEVRADQWFKSLDWSAPEPEVLSHIVTGMAKSHQLRVE